MQIRPAQTGDMDAIAALYRPFVETSTITFELEPPEAAEMTRRWSVLVEAGYPYLIATDKEDMLLGYAYCGPFRSREAYRFCCENSVYIEPKTRRSGVGTALMQAVIQAARAKGLTQMIAVITDTPETATSVAFHEALGFHRVGTLEKAGFKFDQWLDVALLQQAL